MGTPLRDLDSQHPHRLARLATLVCWKRPVTEGGAAAKDGRLKERDRVRYVPVSLMQSHLCLFECESISSMCFLFILMISAIQYACVAEFLSCHVMD